MPLLMPPLLIRHAIADDVALIHSRYAAASLICFLFIDTPPLIRRDTLLMLSFRFRASLLYADAAAFTPCRLLRATPPVAADDARDFRRCCHLSAMLLIQRRHARDWQRQRVATLLRCCHARRPP